MAQRGSQHTLALEKKVSTKNLKLGWVDGLLASAHSALDILEHSNRNVSRATLEIRIRPVA